MLEHDHTTLTQARTMVLTHGGLTVTLVTRLRRAGYSLDYIAALVNIWKGNHA